MDRQNMNLKNEIKVQEETNQSNIESLKGQHEIKISELTEKIDRLE